MHTGSHTKEVLCLFPFTQYDDQAEYRLQIGSGPHSECDFELVKGGRNNWIPLIVAALVLFVVLFTIRWTQLFVQTQRRFRLLLGFAVSVVAIEDEEDEQPDLGERQFDCVRAVVASATGRPSNERKRLVTLDTFRGCGTEFKLIPLENEINFLWLLPISVW